VVDPQSMIDQYGVDQVRYFFLREVPFGQDGNYSHEAIVNRVNADLANDLGNLAQRSLSMIAKNCDGQVPTHGDFTADDREILDAAYAILDAARAEMDQFRIHKALEIIWKVVADANRYFAGQEPWALKKTDPDRMNTVLYTTAEVIRVVATAAQPFIPAGAAKLLDLLSVAEDKRQFRMDCAPLVSGTALPKPEGVFPRYVEPDTVA
jgi:methionyl-tRNA synthetase